ncbi:hypothetical protein [Mycobacterium sp.]|uniref:hypothetical protein n=1 Tax=Mycobacterium sp. TaxID=1785 RepID=UPI003F9E777D
MGKPVGTDPDFIHTLTHTASDDGQIVSTEGTLAIHEVFGLNAEWPQVDEPG